MLTRLLLLWILAAQGQPAPPPQTTGAPLAGPRFFLRVDPRVATEVNEVLARVAQRIEVAIPADRTAEEYLTRVCGGHPPTYEAGETPATGDASKVLFSPCVQVRRNLRLEVRAGDTLEGLAVRNGLPPAAAMRLKVIPAGDSQARPIRPENLQVGDVVVIPEAPVLASVVMNPAVVADRGALVRALADKLECGQADPEECLARHEVTVLDSAATGKAAEPSPPLPLRNDLFSVDFRELEEAVSRVMVLSNETIQSTPPPPPPPPAPVQWEPAPPSSEPEPVSVAPEQWPYDAGLVAAILKDAADSGYIKDPTVIGIADDGLGSPEGKPLPGALFDIGLEQLQGEVEGRHEPDGEDNDKNGYVDDFFGAGVIRTGEVEGTGDLCLCSTGQPPFADWVPEVLLRASHGAVVSSIAAALDVRRTAPAAAGALPKLVFFRMLESACAQEDRFDVAEGEMAKAFEYLQSRSDVINISYGVNLAGSRFVSDVKDKIPNGTLLVLPAGNDSEDLDEVQTDCLPCLGNDSSDHGGPAARSILVVGAAEQNLRRAWYSGYGARTVGIFAPAEPTVALDLAERQLSSAAPSTSYAAPLAALAAGIVRSFGGKNSPSDIKDRLLAATWPLDDAESQTGRTHVGVLDLVKVAAVRHHAVEVEEAGPDGHLVRRTYVGKLHKRLQDLKICAGTAFREDAVHAIRLGKPAGDGERQLLIYFRNRLPGEKRRPIKSFTCRPEEGPEEDLGILTLAGDEKTFHLSQVTQIQLKWLLP
jgi:hypothetical protein